MNTKLILVLLVAIAGFGYWGCISEPDLEGYPVVSFTTEVQPIITGNCGQDGCHGNVGTEKFALVTYDDIMVHVSAGNARKSNLYQIITNREDKIMPPLPANPLNDDQIRSIFVWIEQGAPNN